MALRHGGFVDLPPHRAWGGFDHAAVHRASRRLFVAHTANDAVDVVDLDPGRHVETVETERGAPTIAHDPESHRAYAFLPGSCRAAVYRDEV